MKITIELLEGANIAAALRAAAAGIEKLPEVKPPLLMTIKATSGLMLGALTISPSAGELIGRR
jgi:hypothetical protein